MVSRQKAIKYFLLFAAFYFFVFFNLNIMNIAREIEAELDKKTIKQPVIQEEVPRDEEVGFSFPFTEKQDCVEVPEIDIYAPIVRPGCSDIDCLKKALDRGAVLHPDSVLPGQQGQTFILGHSASAPWPNIKYDWVFSRLNELEAGDIIIVNFDHQVFTYQVNKKIFLEKGEQIPEHAAGQSLVYLISCWPPGRDVRRIAVQAVLKLD